MVNYNTYYVPKFNTEARSFVYYIKIVYNKLSFFIMLLLSTFLIINYNNNSSINKYINTSIQSISKPCVYVVNAIDNGVKNIFSFIHNITFLYKENNTLKQENELLRQKLFDLDNLEYENQNLKNISNYINNNKIPNFITLKYNIIAKGKFSNKITLNIGSESGLNDGNLVIDKYNNFIGKIVRSKDNYSEIMLITDINSKIEAITYKNKIKLIVNGTNSDYLNILYVANEEYELFEDDLVFFMNNNAILPSELYIGKIVKIDNEFKVKIDKNFNDIDYITVINKSK